MELTFSKLSKGPFYLICLALLSGLILSIVSYLELCSAECKASHDWRLFGLPFAPFGIAFFTLLLTLHVFSFKSDILQVLVGLAIFGALGAETLFILIQKYKIGHWCPVCLGIAASVGVAAIVYGYKYFRELHYSLTKGQKGDIMNSLWKGIGTLLVFLAGLLMAFVGVSKESRLDAAEQNIKEQIVFGDKNSPIQAYLFTDWACPACRALEAKLRLVLPTLEKNTQFAYVDLPVHPETLNFSPYNLSFMVNNKEKYVELRDLLTELSTKTKQPTDKDIQSLAKKAGVEFKELNYQDVALALKHWKELAKQFNIDATPTLILVNMKAKKGKKLAGVEEITETNINKAIEALK